MASPIVHVAYASAFALNRLPKRAGGVRTPQRFGDERVRRLLDAGRALVADLDTESILAAVLVAARDLTGARYAAFGVLDSDRRELARFVTLGVDAATQQAIGAQPCGRGVLGELISDPRPLRLSDIGAHPYSYGFPSGHPPMHAFLGVPVIIRGAAWGNLYLAEKAGGFDDVDEETVVVLAEWAAVAIENARLYGEESVRRRELERAVGALEATTEITRAIGAETQLDRVLELIVKRARALVDAGSVLILLRERDELVVAAAAGQLSAGVLGTRVPIRGSASGAVLRARQSQRLVDGRARLRFDLAQEAEARTGLLVPLVYQGRSVGVLEAFDRVGDDLDFSPEDERLMQAFAASAANAVATAQSVASQGLRRSIDAADRERAHWARELHDETLQSLAATKISLSAAARTTEHAEVLALIREVLGGVDESIRALRSIISDLRPAALDVVGTRSALESLAERVRVRGQVDIDLCVDLSRESGRTTHRHPPALEDAIYRIVQEALTNVVKHAAASRATVTVTELGGGVAIEIRDDGNGFEQDAGSHGFGLIGIRERVQLAQGTFHLASSCGSGTTMQVHLPVPETVEAMPPAA